MPTEVLAIGTGAANSSDIVVAAGTPKKVMLKDAQGVEAVAPGTDVRIKEKDASGAYYQIGKLDEQNRSVGLPFPGTYRLSRVAGSAAVGADVD